MGKIIRKKKSSTKDDFESSLEPVKQNVVDPNSLVPSGSTTLNLECSGRVEGAFQLGKIVNIIGDSSSGKSLIALTMFAECSLLERFDDFRFIYDDVEAANEFDVPYLFGKKLSERLESDIDSRSRTIEDFNDNLARACKDEKPFIYVLDSFDALTSEAAQDKDSDNRKKREKGGQIAGSYGDGKAKKASEMFSQRTQDIADKKSLVIIISQTRDNLGFGALFTPKTRSGGKALKFYSAHEVWLACQKKEKKGKRVIITNVQVKLTKNKITGRHGEAYYPVLFDIGIDNLSSMINFLMDEGPWSGTRKIINTKGFVEEPISFINLIKHIEHNNLEDEIELLCQEAYDSIMEKLKPNRKRKFKEN